MVNYLTWVHSRLNVFLFFLMYLCTYAGFEIKYILVSTNELTFYKIISSGEMLKRQSLLMCQSKRTDGVKKSSDGRFKMRREKGNFSQRKNN